MENNHAKVYIYIDDEPNPIAELNTPVKFLLDTSKLVDGEHMLKIVSKFGSSEGLKKVPFIVRNGPIIHLDGLDNHETINGIVPIMLNAYDTSRKQSFIIKGSESPRTIPVWVWVIALVFVAWAIFYLIRNFSI